MPDNVTTEPTNDPPELPTDPPELPEPTDDPTDTAPVKATVICHTADAGNGAACANADIPIPVEIPAGASVVCGVCGQPITDVSVGGGT